VPDYIELRTRSAFSFLAGASLPEDLIARAAALDYPVLALGDRDGVYGAPRFHRAAQQAGVRALIGCALRTSHAARRSELYVLVENRTGYRNLCKLLTRTKLRAAKGEAVATWDDLDGHTEGLVCLAGGADGPLAAVLWNPPVSPLGKGGTEGGCVDGVVCRLQALFGDRLYIDVQRHLDPAEERLNRSLLAIAERHRIPVVATNDVRHATADGRRLLDILTCIGAKTTLDAAGRRLLANAERHLKSPRAMAALFADMPEAVANTRRIAERCAFTLADLGYRFPDYPLPPGETPMSFLRALVEAVARERYGTITARIHRQLEHELAVIGQLELAGYFLIVWDIVRFCRAEGIFAQGRGSAANSAVCYALGITAVDPIGMELLFERFLSPERGEWPDIDIDLPSGDQRERVIQYVYQRYGERGAAMTANVITYRTRSAVREVGKALGFSLEQVDRLSKLLQRFEFRDDLDDLVKQLRAGGVDPDAPRVRWLVELVAQIQNLPRHLGQHSGGMVIAAGRLDEIVPLEPAAMPGRVVVQWDKDDCADLGIIKVDLLGLGMLAVLEDAIPLIRAHEGVAIDLAHLPPDDPVVYRMLQRADTVGVFQVESRAQMATLPRLKPERFYDLVVEVALIRPGPIVGQMVHPYLDRRNGRAPVTYAHPLLEPILRRTLGVPLFQEQILRMAMVLAGFSGGEAEELRRAMGFKRSVARMREIETRLRAGMAARGIAGAAADAIVRSVTSFALYGFPESHAASFALIAYASAYLRAHHLAAFTCAMLNNWPLGFYHPATLVQDAQRHGLRVLPIDVARSAWRCTLEEVTGDGWRVTGGGREKAKDKRQKAKVEERPSPVTRHGSCDMPVEQDSLSRMGEGQGEEDETMPSLGVRLGLRYVSGLRRDTAERLVAARNAAPFASLADLAARVGLHDGELQALAHAGACAAFGCTRRAALWQAAALPREPLFVRRQEMTYLHDTLLGDDVVKEHWDDGRNRAIVSGFATVAPGDGVGPTPLPSDQGVSEGRTVRPALRDAEEIGEVPPTANNRTTNSLSSPLPEMSRLEETLADYRDTGLTTGPQIMAHLRPALDAEGVLRACDLAGVPNGRWVKVAGLVIVRQRPGTAKGFCFLTLEDETGLGNVVVVPDLFQRERTLIHTAALLLVGGPVQSVDSVIHVRARCFRALALPQHPLPKSHDYR
jgi:error-prone DNA polymerase